MIQPVELYHLVGRDAYAMADEWNEQERLRMEAVLAEQDRLRNLEEAYDE